VCESSDVGVADVDVDVDAGMAVGADVDADADANPGAIDDRIPVVVDASTTPGFATAQLTLENGMNDHGIDCHSRKEYDSSCSVFAEAKP